MFINNLHTIKQRVRLVTRSPSDKAKLLFVLSGAHNEKERTTLNTAREPTFHQKST